MSDAKGIPQAFCLLQWVHSGGALTEKGVPSGALCAGCRGVLAEATARRAGRLGMWDYPDAEIRALLPAAPAGTSSRDPSGS